VLGVWSAVAVAIVPLATPLKAEEAPPFERIRVPQPEKKSYIGSYLTMATGLGLVIAAFPLRDHADEAYEQYLTATEPDEIESFYDEATRYDNFATASMLTGEALLVLGIYLRFLREPAPGRLGFRCNHERVALSLKF
jgi:hypothetical protein